MADGRKVYRQLDGTFKQMPDERKNFRVQPKRAVRDIQSIGDSFSPEMYAYSHLPHSNFSLHSEFPQFELELSRIFITEVNKLLDAKKLPAMLVPQILSAQVEHLLSSIPKHANAYLEIFRDYERAQGAATEPKVELIAKPREAVAHMVCSPLFPYMHFEKLNEKPSFLGLRFISSPLNALWGGPFPRDKARELLHDMTALSVRELADEGRLFFLNHPVRGLEHFKQLARDYCYQPAFATTFLDVYARLLTKKINPGACVMMMMKE